MKNKRKSPKPKKKFKILAAGDFHGSSEIAKKLKEVGLSNKESEVYIALLKNSPTSGGDLAKFLNMDRTHTYNVLKNLVYKGLASHIIKEKKTLFQASSPKNLLNQIQQYLKEFKLLELVILAEIQQ